MSQSYTPEMDEAPLSMDKMTSVQQNREMKHENPKHDEASTCLLLLYFRLSEYNQVAPLKTRTQGPGPRRQKHYKGS